MRGAFRSLFALLLLAVAGSIAMGQQRPLLTEDVDVVKPGVVRIETGFAFLQNQQFPLSGLKGNVTQLADSRLSFGLSPMVEFQIEWTARDLLSIKSRQPSPLALKPGLLNSTSDVGDARLWMKIKMRNETAAAPSLGFRFGVQLPNSDQSRGIGTNTTNFYGMVTAGKRFMNEKLNVFGNIGLGILTAPLSSFSQNDVLLYGVAGIYNVSDNLNLLGEVNGVHSTRKNTPLGTEGISEARIGAQINALGLRWDAAGIFGVSKFAPKTGFSLGITYDWDAFTPIK
jgi:hypothetical protein